MTNRSVERLPPSLAIFHEDNAQKALSGELALLRRGWLDIWEFQRLHHDTWLETLGSSRALSAVRSIFPDAVRPSAETFPDWRALTVLPKLPAALAVNRLAAGAMLAYRFETDGKIGELVSRQKWAAIEEGTLVAADKLFTRNRIPAEGGEVNFMVASEKIASEIIGHGVWVTSPLEAVCADLPLPADFLWDCTLKDAYRRLVLSDLDLVSAIVGAEVMNNGGLRQWGGEIFGTDDFDAPVRFGGPAADLLRLLRAPTRRPPDLSVPLGERECIDFLKSFVGSTNEYDSGDAWIEIFANRHSMFFRCLGAGKLRSHGRASGATSGIGIDKAIWEEERATFDLVTGDLSTGDGLTWRSITVQRGNEPSTGEMGTVAPPYANSAAPSAGKRLNQHDRMVAILENYYRDDPLDRKGPEKIRDMLGPRGRNDPDFVAMSPVDSVIDEALSAHRDRIDPNRKTRRGDL
ncbi:hypothetical protein [Phreatobacter stygius]|uniref:Uncharacterized protein n=1 Tax=Phreatobacter stygius TaxID=1940610 RepID=A0A4D7BM83_9HYPH|nr:hypothetical protein [Phreatobacter stygius]QCI68847.1 hypothetical protein E8M01_34225 [Phreatobacter stygius]